MFQIDFAVFFDMQSAPHAFCLLGLNFNTLHDLLRVILSTVSVCLSVHRFVSNLGRAGNKPYIMNPWGVYKL